MEELTRSNGHRGEGSESYAFSPIGRGMKDDVDEENRPVLYDIQSPPPGHLNCLWYSKVEYLHVFAMEKVLGWKTRPVVNLESCESEMPENCGTKTNRSHHSISLEDARNIMKEAIENAGNDFRKRREISRIKPTNCPHVKKIAADRELAAAKVKGSVPKFMVVTSTTEREEVFLVRWRGRSYMHCSWERQCDLMKYDQSGQQEAAYGEINQFVQNQVESIGQDWKRRLEDRRQGAHHCEEDLDDEEYFSPLFLQVDRILGCDAAKLDVNILARQRAWNLRVERGALKTQEDDYTFRWDTIRYIVRWKGLELTEATWEYWGHIKRDFVNEVEDFWLRERELTTEEVEQLVKVPSPCPEHFIKLEQSPNYGISNVKRLIAKLDDEDDDDVPCDDAGEESVLRLRTHQLVGVNWLLCNWYNHKSCILADETGLGKKIQSIGFLHALQNSQKVRIRGPFIIVAPSSRVSVWETETKKWAPDVDVVVYHGSQEALDFLVQNEFYYARHQYAHRRAAPYLRRNPTKIQLLITTYDDIVNNVKGIAEVHWKALIVDQADQRNNIECLSKVRRDWCVFLTGTPFKNCTDELLRTLLHVCDPNLTVLREKHSSKLVELQNDNYLLQRSVAILHQPIPSEQWQQLQQQNQILHQENQKLQLQLQEQNQMLWFMVSQWQYTTSRSNTNGMLGGVGMQNEIMLMSTESVAGNDNESGGGEAPEAANEHRGIHKIPARSDSPCTTSMPDIAQAIDGLSRRAKRAREKNVDDEVAELECKAAVALMRLQADFC